MTAPQLDYGQHRPIHRRRRWRRALLVIVLIGCVASGWELGRPYVDKAKLLYAQHQCLRYAPPPDQIVYASEAYEFVTLGGQSPEYKPATATTFGPANARVVREPRCWDEFQGWLYPLPSGISGSVFWGGHSRGGTVFLHELRTPDGRSVGARLGVEENVDGNNMQFQFWADLFIPGSWTSAPSEMTAATQFDMLPFISEEPPRLRFFAGHADPADLTHFTIRYQAFLQDDILDGRIANDGTITLKQRVPPDPAKEPQRVYQIID